jgi:hypothetical protein
MAHIKVNDLFCAKEPKFESLRPYFEGLTLADLIGYKNSHEDELVKRVAPVDKIRLKIFCKQVLSQFYGKWSWIDEEGLANWERTHIDPHDMNKLNLNK